MKNMKSVFWQHWRHLRHMGGIYRSLFRNRAILSRLRKGLSGTGRKLILVTLLEQMGDIVACEPVARHLKSIYPDCHLVWGVRGVYRELVAGNPQVDTVLTLHCLSERLLLAQSGLCDETVDLHFHDRFCTLCRRPMKRAPTGGIDLTNYLRQGSILEAVSLSAGLPALQHQPRVYIPGKIREQVDRLQLPAHFLVAHCTSAAAAKDWPVERWQQLVHLLSRSTPLKIVEVGSASALKDADGVVSLCGRISMLASAEVIRRAQLFIGIDSGPAHLANAVATPGVVLLGSYLGFDSYTPFSGGYAAGETATLLRAEDAVANIPVEQVLDAVLALLARRGAPGSGAVNDRPGAP